MIESKPSIPRSTFYLTFGQKSPLRRGWIQVQATSYGDATEAVEDLFGLKWANLYSDNTFDPMKQLDHFPDGKIGETIIAN